MRRSTFVRVAVFLATVFAAWAVLSLGSAADTPDLEIGEPSPQRFEAAREATVEDEAETERRREEARGAIPEPRQVDAEVDATVLVNIQAVFEDLQELVMGEAPDIEATPIPTLPEEEETETTVSDGEETEEQVPAEPAVLTGLVFIDVDRDGLFDPDAERERVDTGLAGVGVEITTHEESYTTSTDQDGVWNIEYPGGPAVVVVDVEGPQIPDGFFINTDNRGQLVECEPGQECSLDDPVGLGATTRAITEVVDDMSPHNLLPETLTFLAGVAVEDVTRAALGEPLHLPTIHTVAKEQATLSLAAQIEPEDLQAVRTSVRTNPRSVFHDDTGLDPDGGSAAAEVVATNLLPNYVINQELWDQEQEEAANQVEPVVRRYAEGELIVDQSVLLEPVHIEAIAATRVASIEDQPSAGLLAVIAVLVALIGIYLATFRPEFWSRPRMLALLGILVVLAAAAVRGTVAIDIAFVGMPGQVGWYVLPAVTFGFVTAVLFDQRIAILMALAVGVLTAVGTLDTGATVYAILAALAPIPFVSAVSTRGAFRNAVVKSSLVAAGVAAATSSFFHIGANETALEVVPIAVAWAFGVSVLASLLGLAALQFFESAFDVTTALSLLDLTDRNHEALQMLQEKAFGTFNHSLMVGTLAHAAARAIGANPLLARAMAYYHDLGKTENPMFFIENQFGMANPHDDLDPKESAKIIREHVSTGVALARDYKIPTEVTEGIVSHHGDGVMRYFYEKARQVEGDQVDIDDFRHIGHKPRTAETAILMLADSLEAACRAEFQAQGHETSPDAIEKVVNRVMDEKMEDGQLSESPLTLGEMTKIRNALLDSLVGHYHQRIPYPNFPGN